MADKRIITNITPQLPLVWFGDGYYGQVRRDFVEENKRVLILVPEPMVLYRFPDLREESQKDGTIRLEFPEEFVIDENKDPASPRLRVLTSLKGDIINNDKKTLLETIRHIKMQNEELAMRLVSKEEEIRGILEDIEGSMEKFKRLGEKIKVTGGQTINLNQEDIGN